MDEYNSFLVTVLSGACSELWPNGEGLIRCAVKTKLNFLDMAKVDVRAELPAHVQSCGQVVKVERIFDIASEEC